MKINKKILFNIGIVNGVIFSGIFIFYLMNPFGNECVKGSCLNGYGVFMYHSGMKYEGEWKNGMKHGKGSSTYPGVYRYEGEWKKNKKDGYGVQVYKEGVHYISKYEGEWKNGNMHGSGTILYQSGAAFVGDLVHGERTNGIFTYGDERIYVGGWKDNVKNGKGTLTYPDGRVFAGTWKDNLIYGKGILTYPDGRKIETEEISGNP